jgi:hypothetical protein
MGKEWERKREEKERNAEGENGEGLKYIVTGLGTHALGVTKCSPPPAQADRPHQALVQSLNLETLSRQ